VRPRELICEVDVIASVSSAGIDGRERSFVSPGSIARMKLHTLNLYS
jgi:hypothetical protein